jgi:hypothetical protein
MLNKYTRSYRSSSSIVPFANKLGMALAVVLLAPLVTLCLTLRGLALGLSWLTTRLIDLVLTLEA